MKIPRAGISGQRLVDVIRHVHVFITGSKGLGMHISSPEDFCSTVKSFSNENRRKSTMDPFRITTRPWVKIRKLWTWGWNRRPQSCYRREYASYYRG